MKELFPSARVDRFHGQEVYLAERIRIAVTKIGWITSVLKSRDRRLRLPQKDPRIASLRKSCGIYSSKPENLPDLLEERSHSFARIARA